MQSKGIFPNFLALPRQTTRGGVTVTKCHAAARPLQKKETFGPSPEGQYSPRDHIRSGTLLNVVSLVEKAGLNNIVFIL
jgi:hypothetical protein